MERVLFPRPRLSLGVGFSPLAAFEAEPARQSGNRTQRRILSQRNLGCLECDPTRPDANPVFVWMLQNLFARCSAVMERHWSIQGSRYKSGLAHPPRTWKADPT